MNKIQSRFALLFLLFLVGCSTTETSDVPKEEKQVTPDKALQESIVEETMNKASEFLLFSLDRQAEIDKGLAKDSTIAYLWQQKAMPLFKHRKYELAMRYIDKAVKYDRERYQDYRAFMKCIFAKTYREAISDFEDCKRRRGNEYVMDHSYDFYIALGKIQLHEFTEAEALLEKEIAHQLIERGEANVHHLDLFYLGIAKFEQGKHEEAVGIFDKALKIYPEFAEVLFYKAMAYLELEKGEEAGILFKEAMAQGKSGNSINEDNELYELYPYQIRWELL